MRGKKAVGGPKDRNFFKKSRETNELNLHITPTFPGSKFDSIFDSNYKLWIRNWIKASQIHEAARFASFMEILQIHDEDQFKKVLRNLPIQ